ncbi:Clr5 domain containing protein, partial [Naviculisporaceae sp. PSN 640]
MGEASDLQSGIVAPRPKGKWATPDEWTAVKPVIRKMYLEDNVPLKDVMSIMETQHGFHGTIKMYKNKLNEWGFFKTFKPREVLDALRALETRKASGEDHPTINMRGTEIDIAWMKDYMKRNRKRINKIVRSQAASSGSSAGNSPPPPPPRTLATTGAIRLTEELLATMNLYVDNAMSCGLWYIDQIGFYRSRKGNTGTYFLYDFWDRLDEASTAMAKSQQIDLIDLLNPAFSRLNDIVREEDPRSFPFLLGCFEVLRLRGRSDLIETFLKYIWQLSATILGPTYPHSRIWRQAYMMFRTGTQEELIGQVFMLLMDRYHNQGTRS